MLLLVVRRGSAAAAPARVIEVELFATPPVLELPEEHLCVFGLPPKLCDLRHDSADLLEVALLVEPVRLEEAAVGALGVLDGLAQLGHGADGLHHPPVRALDPLEPLRVQSRARRLDLHVRFVLPDETQNLLQLRIGSLELRPRIDRVVCNTHPQPRGEPVGGALARLKERLGPVRAGI
jgi:hypothetical protein